MLLTSNKSVSGFDGASKGMVQSYTAGANLLHVKQVGQTTDRK